MCFLVLKARSQIPRQHVVGISVTKSTTMPCSSQDINCLNRSSGRIEWLRTEDKKVAEDLWVPPLTSGLTLWLRILTNSPPYSSWNHSPISFPLQCIASCGILLNCIFKWYSKMCCAWLSTTLVGINLDHRYIKHQINGRALALSSLPWFTYNIYIMYNLNTMGSKLGCYI